MPGLVAWTLAALSLLASGAAWAQRPAGCPPVPAPAFAVTVRAEVSSPRLDRGRSLKQLSAAGPHAGKPGTATLGLMQATPQLASTASFRSRPSGTGVCVWVESFELLLRFPEVAVFIASEYAPGSCAYRVILAHENRHVQIARDEVARQAGKFRLALNAIGIPTARAPMPAASLEEAKAAIQAEAGRLLRPAMQQFGTDYARAQALIDTPEAYAREKSQCTDW